MYVLHLVPPSSTVKSCIRFINFPPRGWGSWRHFPWRTRSRSPPAPSLEGKHSNLAARCLTRWCLTPMEKPQAQKWIKTSNPGQVTTEPTWHSFAIYLSSVKFCISTTRAYLVCCNSSLATSMYRMLLKLCTIKPFLLWPGSCRLSALSAC